MTQCNCGFFEGKRGDCCCNKRYAMDDCKCGHKYSEHKEVSNSKWLKCVKCSCKRYPDGVNK